MRFGCFIPQTPKSGEFKDIRIVAEKCEELGFSSVWIFDHMTTFPTMTEDPFFECWTTLSALTQCTRNIMLGSLVTCNSFRNPSLLAKMAATVDVLSRGRLVIGVGAGWFEDEHTRFGFNFPPLARRIKQLGESLEIIKGLWTKPRVTFKGDFYEVEEAFCTPKPSRKPHPPIWIGGRGKGILRLVAKYGDGCNLGRLTPEECTERLQTLTDYCEQEGRKSKEIVLSYLPNILFDKDSSLAEAKIKRYLPILPKEAETDIEGFKRKMIVGGPGECIKRIEEYASSGVDYFTLSFPDISEELLTTFSEEVLSHF